MSTSILISVFRLPLDDFGLATMAIRRSWLDSLRLQANDKQDLTSKRTEYGRLPGDERLHKRNSCGGFPCMFTHIGGAAGEESLRKIKMGILKGCLNDPTCFPAGEFNITYG